MARSINVSLGSDYEWMKAALDQLASGVIADYEADPRGEQSKISPMIQMIATAAIADFGETARLMKEIKMLTRPLCEQARDRVRHSDRLSRYADTILYDWPEGDEHWRWVVEADESEILDWAETVEAQQGGENL